MNRPQGAVVLSDGRKQLLKLMLTDPEISLLILRADESLDKSTISDNGTLTIRKGKSSWISRLFGEERQLEFMQVIMTIYNSLVTRSPAESKFNIVGIEAIGKYVTYSTNYDVVVDIFFDHMRRINTNLRSIQLILGQEMKNQGLLAKVNEPPKKDGGGQGNQNQQQNNKGDQNQNKEKDKGNQNQNQNQNKGDQNKGDQNKEKKEQGNQNQNQNKDGNQSKKPPKEPTSLEELKRMGVKVDIGAGQQADIGDLIVKIQDGERIQNNED
jgi:hypothetical protein